MFKKYLLYSITIVLFIVFFSNCSKKEKKTPTLPENCALVIKTDLWKISTKGALYELLETPLFKELINALDQSKQEIIIPYIENPFKAGIDILEPIYTFVARDDVYESSLIGIRMKLSNAQKFSTLVKNITKFTALPIPILIKENANYFMAGQWILAWSETDLIFLYQEKIEQRILLEKLMQLTTHQEKGTHTDPNFQNIQKQSADIAMWFNFNQFSKEIAQFQKYIFDIETPKQQFLYIFTDFVEGGINTTIQWRSPEIKENFLKYLRKKGEQNPQFIFKIF
ncbi:MAG: DUF4836 family protein [Salinivirgaceae bacterium]|nr:DUF4836 family protein [Salinivirgaceae bacterium]MDD4747366.1 DUF4836 family protein [Salinivirgaceae bacterium]MDY0279480.1 DUF4836 family protein [Salinivirgaceae bacterium]